MEEKLMDEKLEKDIQDHIKHKKVDYTKYKYHRVYNRKILRSMLKHQMGSNKIRGAWKQIQKERRSA